MRLMRKSLMPASALLLMLLGVSSCVEEIDNNRSSGILSASQNGLSLIDAYDLGSQNSIELSVAKGGLQDNGGTVTFTVDQTLLDSLNTTDGTSYQMLPSECYTLENSTFTVTPGGDRRVVGGKLVYDPHKINLLSENNKKYALAFRVSSTGTPINSSRTSVIYAFNIKDAVVNLTSTGGSFTVGKDGTVSGAMNLATQVGFNNQWDLTTSLSAKGEDYVDEYNATNESFFALLPATYYTIADATIAKGKQTAGSQVILNGKDLAPGNYLLPVAISNLNGQGDANITYGHTDVTIFTISKLGEKIDRSNWTVTGNTEEATGESNGQNGRFIHLIDGDNNTFWHSQWNGGEVAPPYELIIDMKKVNAVSQLGLLARQDALTKMNIEIYAGNDGATWDLIGKYYFDGNNKQEQSIAVKACEARYIRLYIPSLDGSKVGHMAELYVYGTDK